MVSGGSVHSEEVLNRMFQQAATKYKLPEELFDYVRDVAVQVVQFDDEPEQALLDSLTDTLVDGGISEENTKQLIQEFVKRVSAPEGEFDDDATAPTQLSAAAEESVQENAPPKPRFVDPALPAALGSGYNPGTEGAAVSAAPSAASGNSSVSKPTRRKEDRFVCDVESMMLMYGGGRLLLRNADLVLKRAHRYGIVGVNGAGKTTLLTMIRQGKIPQLVDTKVVAVDEISAGGENASLTVAEYARQRFANDAKGFGATANQVEPASSSSKEVVDDVRLENALSEVGFRKTGPEAHLGTTPALRRDAATSPRGAAAAESWTKPVSDLSGGWRMRLALAIALLEETAPDLLLLDEPTNHLDVAAVQWLTDYLVQETGGRTGQTCVLMVSHDPVFLNGACSDIIHFHEQKLAYYEGNFEEFKRAVNLGAEDASRLLEGKPGKLDFACLKGTGAAGPAGGPSSGSAAAGSSVVDATTNGVDEAAPGANGGGSSATSESWLGCNPIEGPDKLSFPIPGKLDVNWNDRKAIIDLKKTQFRYDRLDENSPMILDGISCKLTMASRVAIIGANGAGKSTLMSLMSGETTAMDDSTVSRHRNLRLAYIAQEHTFHLKEFWNCAPLIYMQKRYQHGWDSELQHRLKAFSPEEEEKITEQAKKFGKYGRRVKDFCGRQIRGKEVFYEVQWEGLDDAKQNTFEPSSKLRQMGIERLVRAYDERAQSVAAGNDQRPLTNREIIRHFENFGFDEDFVTTRTIGSFSMGQKSRLTLGAALWIKPHLIMMDEPTNYIDADTLAALERALKFFKGAVAVISHNGSFVKRVCKETWTVEGGKVVTGGKL